MFLLGEVVGVLGIRRTNFSNHHGHDQHSRRVFKAFDGEYTFPNGGGHLLAKGNSSDELGDCCQYTSLDQGQRS